MTLFINSCCCFLKILFSARHCRIFNWSKRFVQPCTCVDQRCSRNFTGTGALLGIFAYIYKQLFIIHWWRWRSGAPAAWHHRVWTQPKFIWNGNNWIPVECSSTINVFWLHTWKLRIRKKHFQIFSTPCKLLLETLIVSGSTQCYKRCELFPPAS